MSDAINWEEVGRNLRMRRARPVMLNREEIERKWRAANAEPRRGRPSRVVTPQAPTEPAAPLRLGRGPLVPGLFHVERVDGVLTVLSGGILSCREAVIEAQSRAGWDDIMRQAAWDDELDGDREAACLS